MSNKEYKERQRKRVMRQYRSNQGRSPNKVYETIKTLKVAFVILLIVSILCFVFL